MLKEKFNKLFNDEGNIKKKVENLVFLLVILIVTVIAINMIWKDEPKNNSNNNSESSKKLAVSSEEQITYEQDSLEVKLEKILSNMNGVGNVDVLITYNETEELIPVYNQTDKRTDIVYRKNTKHKKNQYNGENRHNQIIIIDVNPL